MAVDTPSPAKHAMQHSLHPALERLRNLVTSLREITERSTPVTGQELALLQGALMDAGTALQQATSWLSRQWLHMRPQQQAPVGFKNAGAWCWLNATTQVLLNLHAPEITAHAQQVANGLCKLRLYFKLCLADFGLSGATREQYDRECILCALAHVVQACNSTASNDRSIWLPGGNSQLEPFLVKGLYY